MLAREYDPPFKPTSNLSDGTSEAQMRPVNFDAESSVAAMKVGGVLLRRCCSGLLHAQMTTCNCAASLFFVAFKKGCSLQLKQ